MPRPKTNPPLPDLYEKFLAEYALHHPPKSTATYRNSLERFQKSYRGELTPNVFIEFPNWLAKQHYKKGTRVLYAVASSVFFDWLIRKEILPATPAQIKQFEHNRKMARVAREKRLPKNPSKDRLDALRQAVHRVEYMSPYNPSRYRDIALIEFLYSTGCRIGEVADLKIRDVQMSDRKARVIGKGRERNVYFSPDAQFALENYWKERGFSAPNDPAFSSHRNLKEFLGVHLTTQALWQIVRKVMKIAGVPTNEFTPHYFRHAFATRMLAESQNLAVVQELLGHESPATTRIYAEVDSRDVEEAYRKVYG